MDPSDAFTCAYEVEKDPEFPGDGDWGCPLHQYTPSGDLTDQFESRWGAPLALQVTVGSGSAWIGMFPAGGLGGMSGAFSCPSEDDLCVVNNGAAYVLDVTSPQAGAIPLIHDAHQVFAAADEHLLLVVGFQKMVAVGVHGVAWRSDRLALDQLAVDASANGHLLCSGYEMHGPVHFEVEASSGQKVGLAGGRG